LADNDDVDGIVPNDAIDIVVGGGGGGGAEVRGDDSDGPRL
jgi:hypothetical protein